MIVDGCELTAPFHLPRSLVERVNADLGLEEEV
jgi:hypothetical protein